MGRIDRAGRRLLREGTEALGDRPVRYRALASRRARYYRLVIHAPWEPVELVIPRGGTLREGLRFLRDRGDWITRSLDRTDDRGIVPSPVRIAAGTVVPIQGEPVTVFVRPEDRRRASVERWEDELLVRLPAEGDEDPHPVVLRWLRREAGRVLRERVEHWAESVGARPTRIAVRDPRTRWGSCSSSGTLSLSWRLLLAPPEVLDSVVIHELAHLKVMDHSPRFYRLLALHCPEYRRHREWLRRNADRLRRIEP